MRKTLLLIMTLAGLFDAVYLLWVYTSPSHPLVCLGTGCDVVRASRYAHLWGHSLPVYGAVMYLALLLAVFAQPWLSSAGARRLAQLALTVMAAGGFGFSLYLTALEAFKIHAWCAWCVGSAIFVTLILLLSLWDLRAGQRATPADPQALETAEARRILRGRFVLVVVLMVTAEAITYRYLTTRPELPPDATVSADVLDQHLVRPDSHATGNPNAPVTVVEFGDFECPACGAEQPVVEQMLDQYAGRVRFVFRQFPLTIHPYAETAAEASECAAQQGKFWEADRLFYARQEDLTEPALVRYAGEMGLDTKRFEQCLIDGTGKAAVERDIEDAKAIGVDRTPIFFVGHQRLVVPQFSQFAQAIDQQLASKAAAGPGTTATAGAAGFGSFGSSANALTASTGTVPACSVDEANQQQATLIRTPEAQQLFQADPKAVFIDVRPASEFAAGHLPGALSIPVDQIEVRASSLPKGKTLVLYEGGKSGAAASDVCAVSRAAARILLAHGFDYGKVKVYQDGLAGWEKAGLPVEK
ncbi:MAG TPA: thioredoxin domain-containing protein [Terriglobia bacterium]